MDKPVGGRGKKAPYETTVKRIPIELEAQIDSMIADYRASLLGADDRPKNSMLSLSSTIALAKKLIKARKSKIDTIYKLVTGIYNTDIDKQDLID
jgi:hypothetical protein